MNMSHIVEELRKHFKGMSEDQYLEFRRKLDSAFVSEHPKIYRAKNLPYSETKD